MLAQHDWGILHCRVRLRAPCGLPLLRVLPMRHEAGVSRGPCVCQRAALRAARRRNRQVCLLSKAGVSPHPAYETGAVAIDKAELVFLRHPPQARLTHSAEQRLPR